MSEPDFSRWDDIECTLDYDNTRWLLVPRNSTTTTPEAFARQATDAWANDCGYPRGGRWADILVLTLETVARQQYAQEPYALLAHIRDIPGQAAYVQPVIMSLAFDEPDAVAFANQLAAKSAHEAVKPAIHELAAMADGTPVHILTLRLRQDDDSIIAQVLIIWQAAEAMLATLNTAGEDIGHIMTMREDMVTQAARIRFTSTA